MKGLIENCEMFDKDYLVVCFSQFDNLCRLFRTILNFKYLSLANFKYFLMKVFSLIFDYILCLAIIDASTQFS